jgi:hypothetical protein
MNVFSIGIGTESFLVTAQAHQQHLRLVNFIDLCTFTLTYTENKAFLGVEVEVLFNSGNTDLTPSVGVEITSTD